MLSKGIDNSNEFEDDVVYNYNSLNNEDFINNINYESLSIIYKINKYIDYIEDNSVEKLNKLIEYHNNVFREDKIEIDLMYYYLKEKLRYSECNRCWYDLKNLDTKYMLIKYLFDIKIKIMNEIVNNIKNYYLNITENILCIKFKITNKNDEGTSFYIEIMSANKIYNVSFVVKINIIFSRSYDDKCVLDILNILNSYDKKISLIKFSINKT